MTSLRGTYTVLITPFTADGGAVDVAALKRLVNWQIEQGIHGLVPLGSTGEFLSLTRDERQLVIEACVETAAGRVPVLIGTGAEWTRDAVEYAKEAERFGADGIMVIPPFYSSPTEDELFEHYRRIGDPMTVFAGILGYESFWLGAQGWVAVCSNLLPRDSARLFELVADAGEKETALALYKKMLP